MPLYLQFPIVTGGLATAARRGVSEDISRIPPLPALCMVASKECRRVKHPGLSHRLKSGRRVCKWACKHKWIEALQAATIQTLELYRCSKSSLPAKVFRKISHTNGWDHPGLQEFPRLRLDPRGDLRILLHKAAHLHMQVTYRIILPFSAQRNNTRIPEKDRS